MFNDGLSPNNCNEDMVLKLPEEFQQKGIIVSLAFNIVNSFVPSSPYNNENPSL